MIAMGIAAPVAGPAADLPRGPNRQQIIAALNDRFRRSLTGGEVMLSAGVAALPADKIALVLEAVRTFEQIGTGDDPYGERDFGAISVVGAKALWKIDCFDRSLQLHSPDAADVAVTVRVMTIMLPSEY